MNLDELNVLFASAWSAEEKAQMFEGLVRGSNGLVAPESAPGPLRDANALGLKWREEAETFMRKAEEGGKKSAAARASRFGTSQPPSGNSRTPFEESSNQATSYKLQAENNKQQGEYDPAIPTPLGSQRTPGGFRVNPGGVQCEPPGVQSDLPNNTEFYLPSSLTEFSVQDGKQQPESDAASSTGTTPSQALAQAPDQPLSSRATPPPPSSAGPLPRQKRGPAIPPLDEFVTWAEKNHPGWEREAAEWHKRLASQDWINGAGKPILNAKSTFNTWMSNGWIKRLPQSQSAKRFLSPTEMQAQEEAAAQNYTPGFRS